MTKTKKELSKKPKRMTQKEFKALLAVKGQKLVVDDFGGLCDVWIEDSAGNLVSPIRCAYERRGAVNRIKTWWMWVYLGASDD